MRKKKTNNTTIAFIFFFLINKENKEKDYILNHQIKQKMLKIKIRKLTIGHKIYSVKMDIFNSKSPKLILYFQ